MNEKNIKNKRLLFYLYINTKINITKQNSTFIDLAINHIPISWKSTTF